MSNIINGHHQVKGHHHDYNRHDQAYNDLVVKILATGNKRDDRTGTGTISLFGERLEFDISKSFPLLTTKRVAWKTCLKELLWFISGSDDANKLKEQGVHIWDGNTSKKFIEQNGLKLEEGKIGQGYGYQWRYAGLSYEDYKNNNFPHDKYADQLRNVIDQIKNNPDSRRHIVCSWDPVAIQNKTVALPPCHILYQFYVNDGKLSCQMYQRSADVFLGLPFNIASYAFLTYIIANLTGLQPDRLIICIGDAHIYNNHITPINLQMSNSSFEEAQVEINAQLVDIDDIYLRDFDVTYKSNPSIKAKMAV